MRSRVSWILSVVCLTIFCLASSLGAVVYRYQDLSLQGLTISGTGSNPAAIKAINDSAWLVGNYYDSGSSNYQPFVWRPGVGRTNLQNPGYSLKASAHGINNQGQIVGQAFVSGLGFDACYWSSPAAAPVALPTTGSSMYENCAYGINEAGQVSGEGQFGFPAPTLAVLWPANHSTGTNLGTLGGTTSSGKGINNAGWVVGDADNSDGYHRACLWVPGAVPLELVTLPDGGFFSSGIAINTQGNVVGVADLTPGMGMGHAFFWNQQTGEAQDMCPADYESSPNGISDANQVVGSLMSLGFFIGLPAAGDRT